MIRGVQIGPGAEATVIEVLRHPGTVKVREAVLNPAGASGSALSAAVAAVLTGGSVMMTSKVMVPKTK
ncbi:MAG TPA: hypothetical protein PLP17_06990, partial [Oligoflexia bacterium]|nr:hypothetical protein [Oligoflexia bacterium]